MAVERSKPRCSFKRQKTYSSYVCTLYSQNINEIETLADRSLINFFLSYFFLTLLNYERFLLDEVRLASQNSVRKELMLVFFHLFFPD